MGADDRKLGVFIRDLVLAAALPIALYFFASETLRRLDPDANAKREAQQKAVAASNRLNSIFSSNNRLDDPSDDEDYTDTESEGEQSRSRSRRRRRRRRSPPRKRVQDFDLTQYEQVIAGEVVSPADIPVTFKDIGGLDEIIEELREAVIYPLTLPHLYSGHSSLLTAPSGVLLYGPPGCGKTMLAKALARESGACFINLHISTLTEKWYGDSNKLVAAVFSLARKLQPAIVFIDEIDAVLGTRRSGEHEASGMVKAEFMTHWDGLASATTEGGNQRICVMGATNRIQDIDEAILRRMPKKFAVGLPNAAQRRSIFELTLRDTKIDTTDTQADYETASSTRVNGSNGRRAAFELDVLVRLSAGMSGSDIKEACRDAAMVPVREYIRTQTQSGKRMRGIRGDDVRGLQTEDFFGLRKPGPAQQRLQQAQEAHRELEHNDQGSAHSGSTEEVDDFDDVDTGTKPSADRRGRWQEEVR
ncbi:mitochondrial dynamin GTPase Msp1 [Saxophila tyrrhenica]|uniref:Mitochondrial dynamin GTPase Msp1 n=1 Tax=Saxophila tyrrhenica TaxID=1690608 RepID=A0AAV9P365_9PEZI|nr:mitochondrial dynamin GTPase Msp1 [Saxophila tyrrhenica]